MNNVSWGTSAVDNSYETPEIYVVFVGYQPGIYTTWKKCSEQVYNFKGACYMRYHDLADAIQAWEISRQTPHVSKDIRDQVTRAFDCKVTRFPNPGLSLSLPFYSEINGVWGTHQKITLGTGSRCTFRKHMGELTDLILEQSQKIKKLNDLCLEFLETLNEDLTKEMSLNQKTLLDKMDSLLEKKHPIVQKFEADLEKAAILCLDKAEALNSTDPDRECENNPYCQAESTDLIEIEQEIDIVQEAKDRGLSVEKLLKELYEAGNPAVGLLGEESGKWDYHVLYGNPKIKKLIPKSCASTIMKDQALNITPTGWDDEITINTAQSGWEENMIIESPKSTASDSSIALQELAISMGIQLNH
jgi:hypothetical protein